MRAESHPVAHFALPTPKVMVSSPTPTSTSASGIYLTVAGTYHGTIYDAATKAAYRFWDNEAVTMEAIRQVQRAQEQKWILAIQDTLVFLMEQFLTTK